jgi:dihydroneopterin aldolase
MSGAERDAPFAPRDTIVLRGMKFHTRVGVLPHEAELPQPVEVDLEVALDQSVRPPHVVDYTALYAAVAGVMSSRHIHYLEEAAEQTAAAALAVRGVTAAAVAVRKPHVPLPGPVEYAEVRITRFSNG